MANSTERENPEEEVLHDHKKSVFPFFIDSFLHYKNNRNTCPEVINELKAKRLINMTMPWMIHHIYDNMKEVESVIYRIKIKQSKIIII